MKKINFRILFLAILVCFFIVESSFAGIKIEGDAPVINNAALQDEVQTAFDAALNQSLDRIDKYGDQPDLAKGFGDAAAMATNVASLNGYQNYDLFAVALGWMLTVQAPDATFDGDKYEDDLEEDGDIYAGVGLAPVVLNIGINAGILVEGLYLNVKLGRLEWDDGGSGNSKNEFKSTVFGIGANYGLIGDKSVMAGLARWRGISLGTGIYYHKNVLESEVELDDVEQSVSGAPGARIVLDPSVGIKSDATTFVIPLEAVTSVQLLWLANANIGAGLDIVMGSTDLTYNAKGDVTFEDDNNLIQETQAGNIKISGGTKDESPTAFRPKLIAGVGLNIGPVKLDVPMVYYPDAGFALGVTAAFVW